MPFKNGIEDIIGIVKVCVVTLAGWITAMFIYFTPMHKMWLAIGVAWIVNFLLGYLAAILVHRERFRFSKANNTFREIISYLGISALFFFIGERMGDQAFIIHALNIVTWTFLYFYLINILKNFARLCPDSPAISSLHQLVSLEFLRRMPWLKDIEQKYLDKKKEERQNGTDKS